MKRENRPYTSGKQPTSSQTIEYPPKGKKEEQFALLIPDDIKPPLKINVVLNYRSAPQYVVNSILGEKAIKLPVINMTELAKEIGF